MLKRYRRNRQFSYDLQVYDTQRDVWHEHFAVRRMDQSSNRVACLAIPKRSPVLFHCNSKSYQSAGSGSRQTSSIYPVTMRTIAVGFGNVEIRDCWILGSSTSLNRDYRGLVCSIERETPYCDNCKIMPYDS